MAEEDLELILANSWSLGQNAIYLIFNPIKIFHYKITTILRKIIFFSESDAFASAVVEELGFLAKVQENFPEEFERLFDENCSKTPKSNDFVSTKTQNNKR